MACPPQLNGKLFGLTDIPRRQDYVIVEFGELAGNCESEALPTANAGNECILVFHCWFSSN